MPLGFFTIAFHIRPKIFCLAHAHAIVKESTGGSVDFTSLVDVFAVAGLSINTVLIRALDAACPILLELCLLWKW